MIVKEIICDRCGEKIEEQHPRRISIEEYSTKESSSYGRYAIGYKSASKIHLCQKCDDAFNRFLSEGGEPDGGEQ